MCKIPFFATFAVSKKKKMLLSELKTGESAVILKVLGHGGFRKRIMEMGFVRGKRVDVLLNAPLKDPIKYKVMGYEVSLRRSEAAMIVVITEQEAATLIKEENYGCDVVENPSVEHVIKSRQKTINIALVGNPNSGKTSLFNAASGSHEHVGNYGGVTVDAKKGRFKYKGYCFNIVDLPGTYSLSAYTPEEIFVRRHLVDSTPDVVVNVVAASNLERNLFLTTELIDMDCSTVMALNMYDELENSGATLDYEALGAMLGVPIVPTVSRSERGIDMLFDTIIDVYEDRDTRRRHVHIPHIQELEEGIDAVKSDIKADGGVIKHFAPRYLAIKMMERDKEVETLLSHEPGFERWEKLRDEQVERIEKVIGEDIETIVTNDKYGFIAGALKETYTPGTREQAKTTEIIDSFVTNKLFGFPIFILLMWLMFECTFSLGQYPMNWIESGVGALGDWIQRSMSDGMFKDMLVDGVIGGVGGVIVFLPNILILYLFISFMEDSGYMARAAFIMDKLMHRIGLHGKSFIPLIMGFGCNVPAIMASRTIESRSSRLITILINPFMSCGARLPIYVLLVGVFFPKHASLVMLSLYLFGIIVAIITAKLLRKFFFKKDETPFVMELPPYRIPTARSTLRHMWEKAAQYLRKMGGIILVASIVVWFLSYFPRGNEDAAAVGYQTEMAAVSEGHVVSQTAVGSDVEPGMDIEAVEYYEQQKNSYIGQLGQLFEPVMKPLGLNWKATVSLLSGMAAKEIVVSTLGVLYSEVDAEEDASGLAEKLRSPNPTTGVPDMTPLSALAFLVFALLYFPCIAALVAISKEAGSWKYAAFSFVYNTVVAWLMAYLVYNIGSLFV